MEIVRVDCPQCKAQLDVKNKLNVPQKVIKCPNCGFQMMVRFRQQATPMNAARPVQPASAEQQYGLPNAYQQQYPQQQYQQQQYPQQQYQQPYQQPYRQPVQDDGRTIYAGGGAQQQPRQPQQYPLWLVSWAVSIIANRLFRQVMLTDLRPAQPVSSFLIMYAIRSTSGATPLAVSLRILMLL